MLGGIALGIGYISPVSTLIKWFPDRPGMATGMAIMGFGGGAFIASPLSVWLMSKFSTPTHVGVAETFIVLGIVYFFFMMVGSVIVRVPAPGWKPAGYVAPVAAQRLITNNDVYVYDALKTPQFWLIWWVLCLNVTAGIGVLGQASAMSQEMFPGHITPVAAAGFVGLMSLFNMGGRFFWASTSDYIGRRNTYFVFMVLGFLLYCTVPYTGAVGSVAGFVICFLIIISMYGGGFATVPAYLRDMYGTRYVGAIHGLLLTAWSAAGIFGPVLVNYIREYNIDARRAEGAGLQQHHVHHGRPAGDRLHLQLPRQGGRRPLPHGVGRHARQRSRWRQGLKGETNHVDHRHRRDHDAPARAGLGLRRHPARLGRDPNADQRDEAVPVIAA